MKISTTHAKCAVCAKDDSREIFSRYGRSFFRCPECGLVFIHPQPTAAELEALYTEEYYASWGLGKDATPVEQMKIATFSDKLDRVEQFVPRGKILDIGCATGFFLGAAASRGWDVHGVEISRYSATVAGERVGAGRIFNGRLEEAGFGDRMFDAVFMSDLIEHVTEPSGFLQEVFRVLRPGGVVAIVTPNTASLSCRLLGRSWPHFKLEHLFYFSPDNLRRLVESRGFAILHASEAVKALTLDYCVQQFRTYPLPVVTQLVRLAAAVLPAAAGRRRFMVRTGELFMIARREQ